MVLAVPKGHPWSRRKGMPLRDLRTEKFISREHGSGTLDTIRQLLSKSRHPADELFNVSMELGSTEAMKEALKAGFGVLHSCRAYPSATKLKEGRRSAVPIRGLTMEARLLCRIYHKRRPLHPIAQAFRDFLKE